MLFSDRIVERPAAVAREALDAAMGKADARGIAGKSRGLDPCGRIGINMARRDRAGEEKHARLDLGVMREPVFFHLQLEPRRMAKRISPVMLAAGASVPKRAEPDLIRPFAEVLHREKFEVEIAIEYINYLYVYTLASAPRFLYVSRTGTITHGGRRGAEVRPTRLGNTLLLIVQHIKKFGRCLVELANRSDGFSGLQEETKNVIMIPLSSFPQVMS